MAKHPDRIPYEDPVKKCRTCGGTGEVLIDPSDRRKGTKTCGNCDGRGSF